MAKDDDEKSAYRLSISIEPDLRRNMRIAAAHADMTVGEWATKVLGLAAEKATSRKAS